MGNKGISPLVAAVLLIAITLTIAGLLAYWASGFVKSGLPETNASQEMLKCAGANFKIYHRLYNSTTNKLTLILINTGDAELAITGVDFIWENGTLKSHSLNQSLPTGGTLHSYEVTGIGSGFQKFRIGTNCPDVYGEG